jgi:ribosomal protein S18 acetylase RimI-like enzyme
LKATRKRAVEKGDETMTRAEEAETGQSLERDRFPVRTLKEQDLEAIVRIDANAMGRRRVEYYRAKVNAALHESRPQVSLVAEGDGMVVGFLMGALHYGEYGRAETSAIIDSLGVHPEYRGKSVGRALMRQFLANVRAVGVENVRTEVGWNQFTLLEFLDRHGFTPGGRLVLELDLNKKP